MYLELSDCNDVSMKLYLSDHEASGLLISRLNSMFSLSQNDDSLSSYLIIGFISESL